MKYMILKDGSCFEFKDREFINDDIHITLVNSSVEDINDNFTKYNLSEISFTTDDFIFKDYELIKIIDDIKECNLTVVLHEIDKKEELVDTLKHQNEKLSDQLIDMQIKLFEEQDI